jgi:amidase
MSQDISDALKASGEPVIPNIADLVNPSLPKLDINTVWDAQLKKWAFQTEYLEAIRAFEAKHGAELDAIIAPITPTAAIRHNQFKYYGYATAINLLDFTSVVVPVTFADKTIDVVDSKFKPLSDTDATVQAECKWLFCSETAAALTVSIQMILRHIMEPLWRSRSLAGA